MKNIPHYIYSHASMHALTSDMMLAYCVIVQLQRTDEQRWDLSNGLKSDRLVSREYWPNTSTIADRPNSISASLHECSYRGHGGRCPACGKNRGGLLPAVTGIHAPTAPSRPSAHPFYSHININHGQLMTDHNHGVDGGTRHRCL